MENSLHFDVKQATILTNRCYYYDLLRIILVVGCGIYYNLTTEFGGIYYLDLMNERNIGQPVFYEIVTFVTNYIYTFFHMPVFISLSGSVYALTKEKLLNLLVSQKAKCLLIPYAGCKYL